MGNRTAAHSEAGNRGRSPDGDGGDADCRRTAKVLQEQAAKKVAEKRQEEDQNLKDELDYSKAIEKAAADRADYEQRIGQISAQKALQLKKDALAQELKAEQDAIAARIALIDSTDPDGPKIRAKLNEQLLQLQRQYNLEVQKLDEQAAEKRRSTWDQYTKQVSSMFSQSIVGMIEGTTTLQQAFASMLKMMLSQFVDFLVQKAAKWVEEQAYELVYGQATQKAAAVSQVISAAAVGAANAGASVAAIPLIGWSMVPEVMASTEGMIMAMAPQAAFAAGGIVPTDMLARVHEREMILPRGISQGLGDMIANGGARGNSGPTLSLIHI